jgi:hypothetical protein
MKRLIVAVTGVLALHAATSTTWEMNSYQDFLRGRLSGLSLTSDGRLTLGRKLDAVFSSEQPSIWSAARGGDGSLYLGTGHRGRLYRVDPGGRGSLVWTAEQPEIFAVAADSKGIVYAGTSPNGKVYRLENGKATEYFSPDARYIWALAIARDGSLMVATGDQGKIFRVSSAGRGEVYYETGQTHVTSLALDGQDRLLAGSEPNGILYRIEAKGRAFVLYDANLPEIRAILPMRSGAIAVAAMGGSLSRKTGAGSSTTSSATPMLTAPPISITVTEEAQRGLDVKPKAENAKPAVAPPAPVSTSAVEFAGVERSAIYLIQPDNTVETVWSSKEENVYDLVEGEAGDLTFSTDVQGRVYRLLDRKSDLVGQTGEGETMRLVGTPQGVLAATSNSGRVFRLSTVREAKGTFESPAHDAGSVARWGRLTWRAETAPNVTLAFQTRTGNTARPDTTWSDWSARITSPDNSAITSPNARFIQWRVEISGSSDPGGYLDSVSVAYLPQNTPPILRSISVQSQHSAVKANQGAQSAATNSSFTVTVTDTGDSVAGPAGTPTQTLNRASTGQIQILWQGEDPDGDKLLYSLYFRGEGEKEWKLLRATIVENSFLLDGDVLADGKYWFRVTASDSPANPANLARTAELVSSPVLIDNTPPVVLVRSQRREGSGVEIDVEAVDQTSALKRCEFSIDAGAWSPVEAIDGVTDSPQERFQVKIPSLRAGEHLIVIRVFDGAGNAGVAKVVVR